MIDLDDEQAQEYLAECCEQLAAVETDLLTMEGSSGKMDGELVSRIFRAVHWVQGGAGVFDLAKIGELARLMENVLVPILSHKMIPTPERVRLLLTANDRLRDLIENPGVSNQADSAEIMDALTRLSAEHRVRSAHAQRGPRRLRMLLVEDDFASRLLLQTFLSNHGECHVAVNGREGVQAFRFALEHGQGYDLICMDIMMPEMDGREAVRQIRELEEEHGILSTFGAKIIMTTAVEEVKEVARCFHVLCDSYLTKPVDLGTLLGQMKAYELIQ